MASYVKFDKNQIYNLLMDTLKKQRLQVFKSITRDLTPKALEKLLDPTSSSKAQSPPNPSHLLYPQSQDPLKSYTYLINTFKTLTPSIIFQTQSLAQLIQLILQFQLINLTKCIQ